MAQPKSPGILSCQSLALHPPQKYARKLPINRKNAITSNKIVTNETASADKNRGKEIKIKLNTRILFYCK